MIAHSPESLYLLLTSRARDILAMEATDGTIDAELLEAFIGARVFELTAGVTSAD